MYGSLSPRAEKPNEINDLATPGAAVDKPAGAGHLHLTGTLLCLNNITQGLHAMPWQVTYQSNLGDTLAEATLDLRRGASAYYVLRLALHRMAVPGASRMSRWQLVRVGWGDAYEWRYSGSERLIAAEYTDDETV